MVLCASIITFVIALYHYYHFHIFTLQNTSWIYIFLFSAHLTFLHVSVERFSLTECSSAWLNNCVGHHNHRHFFLFCVYMCIGCFYVSMSGYPLFKEHFYGTQVFCWIFLEDVFKQVTEPLLIMQHCRC